jgi:hypothetical protein
MPIEYTGWEAHGKIRSVPDPVWMRRIRLAAGESIAGAADLIGCSYQNLQGIEKGLRPCPASIATAYAILFDKEGT